MFFLTMNGSAMLGHHPNTLEEHLSAACRTRGVWSRLNPKCRLVCEPSVMFTQPCNVRILLGSGIDSLLLGNGRTCRTLLIILDWMSASQASCRRHFISCFEMRPTGMQLKCLQSSFRRPALHAHTCFVFFLPPYSHRHICAPLGFEYPARSWHRPPGMGLRSLDITGDGCLCR